MTTKIKDQTFIYFDLYCGGEKSMTLDTEFLAYQEIWRMLKEFSTAEKLMNEGHDSYGSLSCCFPIEKSRLNELRQFIEDTKGGGDDIIYLIGGFEARCFSIVDKPGQSGPIPFDDWEYYIEELNQ